MQRKKEVSTAPKDTDLTVVATVLCLKKYRHIFAFMGMSNRVARQLNQSPGAVRYAMKTDLPKKRFYTFSVWPDRKAMADFVRAEPHATAVKRFPEWAAEGSGFVEWTTRDGAINWREAFERLKKPTFSYKLPAKGGPAPP